MKKKMFASEKNLYFIVAAICSNGQKDAEITSWITNGNSEIWNEILQRKMEPARLHRFAKTVAQPSRLGSISGVADGPQKK